MTDPEVIVNLWYYVDENKEFIFSLAGRGYIADGTDEEKIELLKKLSTTDYPNAICRFVPNRYKVHYAGKTQAGIAPVSELDNPSTQLFEEIYQGIEADMERLANLQHLPLDGLKIPENPLFVMTALYRDDYGEVQPYVSTKVCEERNFSGYHNQSDNEKQVPPQEFVWGNSTPWERGLIKSELELLLEKMRQYRHSTEYADFFDVLTFIKQSPYLAPYNAFLVMQQRPDATLVLPQGTWERSFKRNLKSGVQPIVIMRNFGPVEFVYDIEDIEGIEDHPIPYYKPNLPTEVICRRLFPVEGDFGGVKSLYEEIIRSCIKEGLVFHDRVMEVQHAGQVALKPKRFRIPAKELKKAGKFVNYEMMINKAHPLEIRLASVIHELAHILCGHLNEFDHEYFKPKETDQEEFEAESVSYLFCYRHGFRPKSEQYLVGYLRDGKEPSKADLGIILKALKGIEDLVKADPATGTPDVFEASIGGYFGTSYDVRWDGTYLIYETYESSGSPGEGKIHRQALIPEPKKWDRFWMACERANLWRWEKSYDAYGIVDGTSWSIHIKIGDREIHSGGSNAYPGDAFSQNEKEYPKPFKTFLRAVSHLANGLPFE
jgi:hypothetical protein